MMTELLRLVTMQSRDDAKQGDRAELAYLTLTTVVI
jgi:hypothetical protein